MVEIRARVDQLAGAVGPAVVDQLAQKACQRPTAQWPIPDQLAESTTCEANYPRMPPSRSRPTGRAQGGVESGCRSRMRIIFMR